MKRVLLLLVAVLAVNVTMAQNGGQTEVGSVMLPNSMTVGGESLMLNGAGIRKKAIVLKLYSGGLYLGSKSSDADAIVNANSNMAIKLIITSSFVSSEAFTEAVTDGFDASMDGNTSPLSSEINKFMGFFSEEIVEDDMFDITYQSDRGVVVYKNGVEKGSIAGMAFKQALFGIWLGDDPADKKLKKGLLGKG